MLPVIACNTAIGLPWADTLKSESQLCDADMRGTPDVAAVDLGFVQSNLSVLFVNYIR